MRTLRLALLILLGLLWVACSPRQEPVYTPTVTASEEVLQGNDFGQVHMRSAILQACASLGWILEETWHGTVEAHIKLSERHSLHVAIAYDSHSCTIHYRHSESMAYRAKSDGTAYIHPAYNNTLKKLEKAIQHNVSHTDAVQISAAPPPPLPASLPSPLTADHNPMAMELPPALHRAVEVEEARQALPRGEVTDLVVAVPVGDTAQAAPEHKTQPIVIIPEYIPPPLPEAPAEYIPPPLPEAPAEYIPPPLPEAPAEYIPPPLPASGMQPVSTTIQPTQPEVPPAHVILSEAKNPEPVVSSPAPSLELLVKPEAPAEYIPPPLPASGMQPVPVSKP